MNSPIPTSSYRTFKGKTLRMQDKGPLRGLLPDNEMQEITKEDLYVNWSGAPIPTRMWEEIKAFMLWTNEKYNSEAQLRLFYNVDKLKWKVAVFPQVVGTGLRSNERKNTDTPEFNEVLATVPNHKGWMEYGSVHHHCNISAFQSGVDEDDELTRPGIHITLGHMDRDVLDFDARLVDGKVCYNVDPTQWVQSSNKPFWLNAPKKLKFPKKWKKFLSTKPDTTYAVPPKWSQGYNVYRAGGYYQANGMVPKKSKTAPRRQPSKNLLPPAAKSVVDFCLSNAAMRKSIQDQMENFNMIGGDFEFLDNVLKVQSIAGSGAKFVAKVKESDSVVEAIRSSGTYSAMVDTADQLESAAEFLRELCWIEAVYLSVSKNPSVYDCSGARRNLLGIVRAVADEIEEPDDKEGPIAKARAVTNYPDDDDYWDY